ncbi:hypothetical protein IWQ57_004864 [Coemansia nantahalensis]|nr:hypothetical protein IWQ57_004864 [Coemansia nantahalensis]
MQMADAWYIQILSKGKLDTYENFDPGCYRLPRIYNGDYYQIAYARTMIYYYESNDCTGYRTVSSKSNPGWANIFHPVRSFKIHHEDH